MKNALYLVLILASSFLLAGCPVNTKVPLVSRSEALPLDESMLGVWQNTNASATLLEVSIAKKNDNGIYHIKVTKESGDYYGDTEFEGWLVKFNGYPFLVTQSISNNQLKKSFFAHQLSIFEDKFLVLEFELNGVDLNDIESSDQFQEAVKAGMDGEKFYKKTQEWIRKT